MYSRHHAQPCKKKMEKKEEKWEQILFHYEAIYFLPKIFSSKNIFLGSKLMFSSKETFFLGRKCFPSFLAFSPFSFCKVCMFLKI